jgi:hypothetical protein
LEPASESSSATVASVWRKTETLETELALEGWKGFREEGKQKKLDIGSGYKVDIGKENVFRNI